MQRDLGGNVGLPGGMHVAMPAAPGAQHHHSGYRCIQMCLLPLCSSCQGLAAGVDALPEEKLAAPRRAQQCVQGR